MFRKRFNGKLKMENSVNSNIVEKLMAHKKGIDGRYLRPTRDECYAEFCKAIQSLTVNKEEKQANEIKKLKVDLTGCEEALNHVDKLESKMENTNREKLDLLDQGVEGIKHIHKKNAKT